MHIKPIKTLSRAELRELAHAAADRGETLADANPCEPGTTQHKEFQNAFLEREFEIAGVG